MPYPSAPCQQHKRHSPEEELLGVLESEHGIVILDVILIKQYVNFFTLSRQLGPFMVEESRANLLIVLDIDQTPFKSRWKCSRILLDIFNVFELVDWTFLKWGRGGSAQLGNGLCFPKLPGQLVNSRSDDSLPCALLALSSLSMHRELSCHLAS